NLAEISVHSPPIIRRELGVPHTGSGQPGRPASGQRLSYLSEPTKLLIEIGFSSRVASVLHREFRQPEPCGLLICAGSDGTNTARQDDFGTLKIRGTLCKWLSSRRRD